MMIAKIVIIILLTIAFYTAGYLMGQGGVMQDLYKCEDAINLLNNSLLYKFKDQIQQPPQLGETLKEYH